MPHGQDLRPQARGRRRMLLGELPLLALVLFQQPGRLAVAPRPECRSLGRRALLRLDEAGDLLLMHRAGFRCGLRIGLQEARDLLLMGRSGFG